MKKIILFIALCLLTMHGCSEYDDERILQDLDELEEMISAQESSLASIEYQISSITALMNSEFVTVISMDANGNYVITYMNSDGATFSITIATEDDVVTSPIIGIGYDEDDQQWYWRQTTDNGETWEWIYAEDGGRYIVGGDEPNVSINEEGYWTVNGEVITDSEGNPILANDVSNILFKEVYVDEETGDAVFVLRDGSEFRVQIFEALSLTFDVPIYSSIADASTKLKITYTVSGSQADDAVVDVYTAYNVMATIDRALSAITVSMDGTADTGNVIVVAYANGGYVLKPLFFTFGEAVIGDPVYDGSTEDIYIEGDQTTIEISVSANIDYTVTIEESAQSWLTYLSTRAMTTTTHQFIADSYEDDSGALRRGKINFESELYGISASITVVQTPNAPENTESGISTASDMLLFAAAVNSGSSISRWQNDAGEVVLLNDIDMSAVEDWTPIGGVDGSSTSTSDVYTVKNPFTGVFNGQGYAIKGLNYTADMSSGDYGYALFGSLSGATVYNLVLGDPDEEITWTFTGTALKATGVAALATYALNSTIESVTNYYNISFAGDNNDGEICFVGGIVAAIKNSTVGGTSKSKGCYNYGDVYTGIISNTQNGGTGMQTGGICAFMAKDGGNAILYSTNYGHVSCPSGRTGGIVGTMMDGNVKNCDNYGLIEDNIAGQTGLDYNNKRMGGLIGGTDDLKTTLTATVEYCNNYGNVLSRLGCRTGGFIGHSNVAIIGCKNEGVILSDHDVDGHGSGWACGYSGNSTTAWTNVSSCTMGGKVGDYSVYGSDLDSCPDATADNAFAYKNSEYFNPDINVVN